MIGEYVKRLSLGLVRYFDGTEDFSEDIGLGFTVETRFLRENDTVCDAGSEYERDVFGKDVVAAAEECVRLGQLHEKEGCTRGRTEGELGGLTGCVDELYDVIK